MIAAHVLVVDDDDDVREVTALALEAEGFVVSTAPDGKAALATLATLAAPVVVVLDLLMPVMNGWETLEALRALGRLDPPGALGVVICTSAPHEAPVGFPVVPKPVALEALVAALTRAGAAPAGAAR